MLGLDLGETRLLHDAGEGPLGRIGTQRFTRNARAVQTKALILRATATPRNMRMYCHTGRFIVRPRPFGHAMMGYL